MTSKCRTRRWIALACLFACLSNAACSRFDRRRDDAAQGRGGPEADEDRRHADLERELSLYSD